MAIVSSSENAALRMDELTYDNLFGSLVEKSPSRLVFQLDADHRAMLGGSFVFAASAAGGAGARAAAADDDESEDDDSASEDSTDEDDGFPSWQPDGTEPASSGTATSIEIYNEGTLAYAIQGFSLDFIGFWTLVMNGDPSALTAAILDGADQIVGGAEDDYLESFDGDDRLDGRGGADVMVGGQGNDTYVIDGADEIYEDETEGNDTLLTSVSFKLDNQAFIETLRVLEGSQNVVLAGNNADNAIVGASGDDALLGLGGNDRISGGEGNDILNGGAGRDVLRGGAGNDVFVFSTKSKANAVDAIVDFSRADDRIHLENKVFKGLKAGNLAKKAFVAGLEATDGNDRILYDRESGTIWFDADGIGAKAAVQIATVKAGLALDASDFFVI